jgi:hypothetical protein
MSSNNLMLKAIFIILSQGQGISPAAPLIVNVSVKQLVD